MRTQFHRKSRQKEAVLLVFVVVAVLRVASFTEGMVLFVTMTYKRKENYGLVAFLQIDTQICPFKSLAEFELLYNSQNSSSLFFILVFTFVFLNATLLRYY